MHTITLKRALKLKAAIEALINANNIPTTVNYSMITSEVADIESAKLKYADLLGDKRMLSEILAKLRVEIATQNVKTGIEQILADIAHSQRLIQIYTAMAGVKGETTQNHDKIIAYQRSLLEKSDTDAYRMPSTTVPICLLTPEEVKHFGELLKEEKQRLSDLEDSRVSLNLNNYISIGDDSAVLLRKHGLI
jgi:hypothetical protein